MCICRGKIGSAAMTLRAPEFLTPAQASSEVGSCDIAQNLKPILSIRGKGGNVRVQLL